MRRAMDILWRVLLLLVRHFWWFVFGHDRVPSICLVSGIGGDVELDAKKYAVVLWLVTGKGREASGCVRRNL